MSDHKAINFTLNIHGKIRGPGNWKLNISHLENKDYQTEVKTEVKKNHSKYQEYGRDEFTKMGKSEI